MSLHLNENYRSLISTVKVYNDIDKGSAYVAERVAGLILNKQKRGTLAIIGLATGHTPKGVYKELINLHKNEGLSFKNVITFNLDEYFPMSPTDKNSYVAFMKTQLFDHIDILNENIYIPDGTLSRNQIEDYCSTYEQRIEDLGGLDMQLLGIGRSGHIGFNEPGSLPTSKTRLASLCNITREDAITDFGGIENVPFQAVTMGIETILKAKEIIIMAWGQRKSQIIQQVIENKITPDIPASFLRSHPNVEFILNQESAYLLNGLTNSITEDESSHISN